MYKPVNIIYQQLSYLPYYHISLASDASFQNQKTKIHYKPSLETILENIRVLPQFYCDVILDMAYNKDNTPALIISHSSQQ